jgi:hypothetical protein
VTRSFKRLVQKTSNYSSFAGCSFGRYDSGAWIANVAFVLGLNAQNLAAICHESVERAINPDIY